MPSRVDRFGPAAWVLAAPLFLAVHLVVESAWPSPYSWARHNISDLGNVMCGPWGADARPVCSPLHGWMNAAFVVCGALLAAGVVLQRRRWGGGVAGPVLLALAGCGWILAGVWPADVDEDLHVLGALLVVGVGNVGLLLVARHPCPGGLRRGAVVAGVVGLVAAVLHLCGWYLGLGLGGTERVAAFALPLWMAVAGGRALKEGPPTNALRGYGGPC